MNQRPPESQNQQQRGCSLGGLSDLCSCTPNAAATPAHCLGQLRSPESLGSVREAEWVPEDGRSQPCERAACWKQIQGNPAAQEPYAIVLPGFKALQAHLGLSRHANPALINSQHFLLLLSRLAFLLPPSLPSSLSCPRGPFPSLGLTDGAELSQSSPAALDKA